MKQKFNPERSNEARFVHPSPEGGGLLWGIRTLEPMPDERDYELDGPKHLECAAISDGIVYSIIEFGDREEPFRLTATRWSWHATEAEAEAAAAAVDDVFGRVGFGKHAAMPGVGMGWLRSYEPHDPRRKSRAEGPIARYTVRKWPLEPGSRVPYVAPGQNTDLLYVAECESWHWYAELHEATYAASEIADSLYLCKHFAKEEAA